MTDARHIEAPRGFGERAFTLIEIVVSLTIIAVIAAVAIPTLKGLDRDEKARVPIKTLAAVVQEVRDRAMRERRSYQIVFEREGIHASPSMYPYDKRDEFLKELENLRMPPLDEPIERESVERVEVQRQDVVNGHPLDEVAVVPAEVTWHWEPPWTQTIPIEQGTECEVLMWGDGEWDVIEGEKMRRWVFQPTGMASPARVRLRTGDLELEAGFDALTGELIGERTRSKATQP
jgi:prepilin-type N-terminal cleavage/methylation domain-containing protein